MRYETGQQSNKQQLLWGAAKNECIRATSDFGTHRIKASQRQPTAHLLPAQARVVISGSSMCRLRTTFKHCHATHLNVGALPAKDHQQGFPQCRVDGGWRGRLIGLLLRGCQGAALGLQVGPGERGRRVRRAAATWRRGSAVSGARGCRRLYVQKGGWATGAGIQSH
eukprot:1158944-Pelagomonas_calceolata.AAC.4